MSFPLYRRPGGVIFLDDDPDYLEMLGEVMPADWPVQLFLRPVACIDLLKQDNAQRENDAWLQQEIIHRWREGALLIPQILGYWQGDGAARFGLVQVAVVDYAMPAMSGLRVLGELQDWPGSRILLTGRADEQLAVSAFNRGLINQFIPKQTPDLRASLTRAVEELRHQPDQRHQQIWCATLSPSQLALLADPVIFQALQDLTKQQGWTEHVVIGAPLGMLALNAQGQASWLQLEPASNLGELAEMALSQGWDARVVQDIRSGSKLIDLELKLALGAGHQPGPCEAFVLNGEAGRLHAAIFALGEAFSPGLGTSYTRFLDHHGERNLPQD
ncbi:MULTISPECIES: response regulator [unclassified Polaromonas]|uniref:response regulator n=1 Tax=unclassified Polaromonas TaxID=2638319 RepID=UPI0018CA3301|nr:MULTISPECIES: response regulator [unclassified Polaromonas]MBG6070777.1 CheY-like chemotaxis protein [Polaromonas sp. CG_9.7]MBG6112914.1 CheY-like chemotaxis protein [Polaromonas sp. CG_9.2]MDH6186387.1 CheY-like chemotaxis protein [Polaromonas sp. CG_23.6]